MPNGLIEQPTLPFPDFKSGTSDMLSHWAKQALLEMETQTKIFSLAVLNHSEQVENLPLT